METKNSRLKILTFHYQVFGPNYPLCHDPQIHKSLHRPDDAYDDVNVYVIWHDANDDEAVLDKAHGGSHFPEDVYTFHRQNDSPPLLYFYSDYKM